MDMKGLFVYLVLAVLLFSGLSFADVNISTSTCGLIINSTNVTSILGLPADKIVRLSSNQTIASPGDCILINIDGVTLDMNGSTVFLNSGSADNMNGIVLDSANNTNIINGAVIKTASGGTTSMSGIFSGLAYENRTTNITLSNITISESSSTIPLIHGLEIYNAINWTLINVNVSNVSTTTVGLYMENSTGTSITNSLFGVSDGSFSSTRWVQIVTNSSTQYVSFTNTTFNQTAIDLNLYGSNTSIYEQDTNPVGSVPSGTSDLGRYINITNNSATGATANLTIYLGGPVGHNTVEIYATSDSATWTMNTSGSYPFSGTTRTLLNFVVGTVYGVFGSTTTVAVPPSSSGTSPPTVRQNEDNAPLSTPTCGDDGNYHFTSASDLDSLTITRDGSHLSYTHSSTDYSFDGSVGAGIITIQATKGRYMNSWSSYPTFMTMPACNVKELEVSTANSCPNSLTVTVKDASTGAAVSGADVKKGTGPVGSSCIPASDSIKQTDSNGQVSYSSSEFSSSNGYCFEASKSGYTPKSLSVAYSTLSCGTVTISADVSCPDGNSLKIMVKDQDGRAVSGKLGLFRGSETGEYSYDVQIGSDGTGSASINAIGEEGDYVATFTPDNKIYQSYQGSLSVKSKNCTADQHTTTTTGDTTTTTTGTGNTGGGGSGSSGGSTTTPKTKTYDLQTSDKGNVGEKTQVVALVDGKPYPNAKVVATLPNGKVISLVTDANGKVTLPLEFVGNYKFSLLNEAGDSVKKKEVQALSTKTGGEGKTTPGATIFESTVAKTAAVAVVGLVVIVAAYFYFRGSAGGGSEYKFKKGSKS